MLQWERTYFAGPAAKIHVVCPANAPYVSDLAAKFGSEYVIPLPSGFGAQLCFNKAIARSNPTRNDIILVAPGNYSFGSPGVVINKPVTIMGMTPAIGGGTSIDCSGSDVLAFNITADGVVLRNLYIVEADSGTVNTITATSANVLIEDVIIAGGGIASTNATIYLTGDNNIVRRCHLRNIRKGISLEGSNSYALENYVAGSDGTAGNFGIQLTGGASKTGQRVVDNTILMTGATNPIGVNVLANADNAEVRGNRIMASSAANAVVSQADTYAAANLTLVATSSTTTPVWINLQAP